MPLIETDLLIIGSSGQSRMAKANTIVYMPRDDPQANMADTLL